MKRLGLACVYCLIAICVLTIEPGLAARETTPIAAEKTQEPTRTTVGAAPVKLYGHINELLSACANAGVSITSTTLPAIIKSVRKGSPAFYGGLVANDKIIKGELDNNRLSLVIKRDGKMYGINLATQDGTGMPARPLSGGLGLAMAAAKSRALTETSTQGNTQVTTKDPAWQKLKNYDIVMLIDQSGSMNDAVDTSGLSKWDWCSNQLTTFASQALLNTGRRFTIVTFNGNYRIKRDCAPQEVQQTFLNNRPGGPTDLATPLDFVLNDYISGARINQLLIVVLTDGEPAMPQFTEKSIIDVTKKMTSPDQIKIVFFEIGADRDGAALIRLLDVGLTGEGARYDIVDANTFERLQKVGLKLALYDTFNKNFQTSLRVSPTNDLQTELAAVRKQLQEAKARNAQNPQIR